ncbi:uncharacterized protein LOC122505170 [Leptopilina heterotoma]|uniref:uncharacterized protein LOC122505170 n=1 Tax=Leptopilina heterotoma TaxID=63436 RepID=UPI001CA81EF3|nr:uncharacterized protein LOC122505170 [Leptopilina heterotoma]
MVPKMQFKRIIIICLFLIFTSQVKCNSSKNLKDAWKGFSMSCTNEDPQNVSVSCHGVRIVRRIVQQLLENTAKKRSIELFDGVTLVNINNNNNNNNNNDAKSSRSARLLMGPKSLLQFFDGKELRIKLPNFLPGNIESAFRASLPAANQARGGGGGGGGGGKKGDGGVMMMALMMGKMMMALGFSALGALAMKALMVSSLALMLSLITAVKKLSTKDDKDEHHVVYAQEVAHHRRRRNDNNHELSPYRGYRNLKSKLS